MGGVCSLEDHPDDAHPHDPLNPHHHTHHGSSISSPTTAHPPTSDDPPRDVLLHRLWTSVVVGELIKSPDTSAPHPLSLYDDSTPILHVVQGMIKANANYAVVRKAAQDVGALPLAPLAVRRKAEVYLGLFDWRDLNSLLIQVCKTNRLHGSTSQPTQAKATPSAATAAAQNALRLQAEERLAQAEAAPGEVEDGSEAPKADTLALTPAPVSATLSAPSSSSPGFMRQMSTLGGPPRPQGRPLIPGAVASSSPTSSSRSTNRPIQLTLASPTSPSHLSPPPTDTIARPGQSSSPTRASATAVGRMTLTGGPTSPSRVSVSSGGVGGGEGEEATTPLTPYLHFLDYKRTPIGLVSNLSGRNPMQVVNAACPLLGGAQLLVGLIGPAPDKPKKRAGPVGLFTKKRSPTGPAEKELAPPTRPELYRLTVLNKDGAFLGCMTQLQLAGWVKAKLGMLGAMADESLHTLGLGRSKRVMTISWKSPVLTALTLIHERRLSALAIVNDVNGRLVGTISCSDVKYLFLAPDLLLTLQRPVSVFVAMLRQSTSFWHVNIAAANAPLTAVSQSVVVKPGTSLRAAVDLLLSAKVRRAWVVNEAEQPIGMVSISDVVKLALPPPAPHAHHPHANGVTH